MSFYCFTALSQPLHLQKIFSSTTRQYIQRLAQICLQGLLLVASIGCSITGKQSTLDPKGPLAQNQMDIFMVTVYVSLFIFVIVASTLVWVIIRYREKPGDDKKPLPKSGHGNPLIEIGLIGASVLLLVIIAIPTLEGIWLAHDIPEDPQSQLGAYFTGDIAEGEEDNYLEIEARGYQWWFGFHYPQFGITTGNEMVIPKDKVVNIKLRSDNVIHSFWLPKIAGKVDLMPGRRNSMWIQADEVGHYYGQCAEYCGEAHAYMLFRADVMDAKDFNAWVAKQQRGSPAPNQFKAQAAGATWQDHWTAWGQHMRENPKTFANDPIARGAQLFMGEAQCIMCHAVSNSPAQGVLGPNLTFVGERRSLAAGILDHIDPNGAIDRAQQYDNIYNWISKSQFYKPGNLMYYTDRGLMNLKFSGLTYERLQSVGVTDKQIRSTGISNAQWQVIQQNPTEDILAAANISVPKMLKIIDLVGAKDPLTFNDFIEIGIQEASLAAKLSAADFQSIKANPSSNIRRLIDKRAFKELNTLYKDEVISGISRWPSDQDYRDIASFLQSLN